LVTARAMHRHCFAVSLSRCATRRRCFAAMTFRRGRVGELVGGPRLGRGRCDGGRVGGQAPLGARGMRMGLRTMRRVGLE
ncbi:MAG: hypothetical protein AAGE52_28715, partial [Myxococcota bacterium]